MSALDLFASALGAFILIAIVLFPYFPNIGSSPEQVAALRAQLAESQQQLAESQQQLVETQQQLAESQQQLAETEQQLAETEQQLAETEQQLAETRQQLAETQQQLVESQQQLAETQQQLQSCQTDLAQTRAELQETQDALQQAQSQQGALQQAQAQLQRCREELRKKFVLVVISWNTEDDVDLHVIDPQGNEFYYSQRTYPGSEAKLEEDNVRGPGNEIWLHPAALPGEYRVYYKLFDERTGSVSVRGAILTPEGREPIPDRRLDRDGQKPLVAVITVDNDGNATLQMR